MSNTAALVTDRRIISPSVRRILRPATEPVSPSKDQATSPLAPPHVVAAALRDLGTEGQRLPVAVAERRCTLRLVFRVEHRDTNLILTLSGGSSTGHIFRRTAQGARHDRLCYSEFNRPISGYHSIVLGRPAERVLGWARPGAADMQRLGFRNWDGQHPRIGAFTSPDRDMPGAHCHGAVLPWRI
jgi:hypothetical protein